MDLPETLNMDYIDSQYRLWKDDPNAVSRDWQFFFEGFEIAGGREGATVICDEEQALRQTRVQSLIHRYRDLGHLLSCTDPLAACPMDHPLLDPFQVGLTPEDMHRVFLDDGLSKTGQSTLQDLIMALKDTYCRSVGVEYMHLQDPDERRWLRKRMEPMRNRTVFEPNEQIRILDLLVRASVFEAYLNRKYPGQTRFSVEGAEALIPLLNGLLIQASGAGCGEVILGMAHRGRLNVLVNILGKPYEEIFLEFMSSYDPECLVGAGDVKYHNGYLANLRLDNGRDLRMFLVDNPSHLESVDPVVEGVARARQDQFSGDARRAIMPLLIHGDAAFAGEGVVAETLNLSQLEGYATGGTVHVVLNNQIGYTTTPENARSTRYATDAAKMIMAPIFHVHGEDPEAVIHTARLACDYRMAFGKDVVIDLICYRRYGHNEGDEPYFTQPEMYKRIRERPPVVKIYAESLQGAGVVSPDQVDAMERDVKSNLDGADQEARDNPRECFLIDFYEVWQDYHGHFSFDPIDTGVSAPILKELSEKLNSPPENFPIHDKLTRLLERRAEAVKHGEGIDWANAEALAFGSLVTEGLPVRLSGQDSGRGTFSQRHSVLVHFETEERYVPLNHLSKGQAPYTVLNSMLSEVAVLGFEYGYSIMEPRGLVMWEAQFGDFANNAQSVIDLYIVSGESKWKRLSGLVMLLPHGWEGLGPEHSSARLERFLQLCADDNIQVCYPSTPAQYFHLLRRQAHSRYRKPLVVMTPKSLLRNPLAVSGIEDLARGTFQEVLDDTMPRRVKSPGRVMLCSGKIYYELSTRREALKAADTVILRLEQFYPFPEQQLKSLFEKYSRAKKWFWVQEEPENMGGYQFVRPGLEALLPGPLNCISRPAASSPATGFANVYRMEQASITDRAVGPAPRQG